MPLTKPQQTVADDPHRFRVCVSGRRFGKTHLAIRELCRFARQPGRLCWLVEPSYRMAKQIVWDKLKQKLFELNWIERVNESDLSIRLVNGSTIALRSADNPDALRGMGISGILIMDEAQDIDSKAWTEVLRPTLSDTGGHALFTGTPKGVGNWLYDLYNMPKQSRQWAAWQFTTLEGQQVTEQELEQARQDLDEKTYKQEYEASFETWAGVIYYNFGDHNIQPQPGRMPDQLHIGGDFNIDPMSACVAIKTQKGLHIVDEISIYGSNTDEMVEEIRNRYPTQSIVYYPDPASKQRKTSAGGRTDLSILQNAGFTVRVRPSHTPVRDRINAVNGALKSVSNHIKLSVSPTCKSVIRSLTKQSYKEGTSVPDNNDNLSHMADAVGYLVDYIYPVKRNIINTTSNATWTMPTRSR